MKTLYLLKDHLISSEAALLFKCGDYADQTLYTVRQRFRPVCVSYTNTNLLEDPDTLSMHDPP